MNVPLRLLLPSMILALLGAHGALLPEALYAAPQGNGKQPAAAAKGTPAPKSTDKGKPSGASPVNQKSLQANEQGVAAVKAKDFVKAEQLFRQALAADAYNLTAVFNLAGMYVTNKKNEAALTLLESYVQKTPNDAGLFARLGDVYFASQRPADAVRSYEKTLSLDPQYPRVRLRLATVYALVNRLPDAERTLLEAVKEEPNNPEIYANLSALQLANGKSQDAIGTAKKGLQLRVSPDLYITLGTAYETSGNAKNALIAYQRARDLGDNRPELTTKIEALKKNAR